MTAMQGEFDGYLQVGYNATAHLVKLAKDGYIYAELPPDQAAAFGLDIVKAGFLAIISAIEDPDQAAQLFKGLELIETMREQVTPA